MDSKTASKVFPEYFKNFALPGEAIEQEIPVYRACRTHKIEKKSFLNTYEENGFMNSPGALLDDPQEYCLSTFAKLRDVKRFVVIDSRYQPPWMLAKGHTTKIDGVSCKTSDWKPTKSSHVDWWLYRDAKPWLAFEPVDYNDEYEKLSQNK